MALTLKHAITATQTTLDVNGTDELENGDLLAIEDEQVLVITATTGSVQPGETTWQRLGVDRGVLGTDEVAHAAATAVTAVETPLGGGGVEVLEDPGEVYPQVPTAVDVGDRIAETVEGELRVFEVTVAGTTDGTAVAFSEYAPDLTPLGTTATGTETWRYLGIVGELPWTVVPQAPTSITQDANGNIRVDSTSTPGDGDPVFALHVAEESGGNALLEINSDGQADYFFQDGVVGGPTFIDFWSTDTSLMVVRVGTEGIEVADVVTLTNSVGGGPSASFTATSMGFYSKAPVTRPAAIADATDAGSAITQLNAVIAALRALGLIAT